MMESKKRDANKKKPKIYKQKLNENKKKEKELKKKEFKIHKQKFDENKKKEDEEPSSIFKKRRRFQLSENYLVPREESERRLHRLHRSSIFINYYWFCIDCSLLSNF